VRTGEDEGLAGVESWARRPFAPGVTHDRLDTAVAAGHDVRTVAAGSVGPDAMVLAVVTAGGGWTVDVGDLDRARDPGDRLIVLDPVPDRAPAGGGRGRFGPGLAGQVDRGRPQAGSSASGGPGSNDEMTP
jgi:hypothetical protein